MGQKPTAVSAAHPTIDDLDVLQHELGNVMHGMGCVLGLLVGAMPGLGSVNGVAILLPMTFLVPPASAIIFFAFSGSYL